MQRARPLAPTGRSSSSIPSASHRACTRVRGSSGSARRARAGHRRLSARDPAQSGRSPEPTPHRRLAYAQLRAGQPEAAWDTLAAFLGHYDRYHQRDNADEVEWLLREDLGLAAAAWLRAEPQREAGAILARVASVGTSVATSRSIRFDSSAESDDLVSLQVYEGNDRRTDGSTSWLRWGGQPCPERLQWRGIACFVVLEPPQSQPYRLRVESLPTLGRGCFGPWSRHAADRRAPPTATVGCASTIGRCSSRRGRRPWSSTCRPFVRAADSRHL